MPTPVWAKGKTQKKKYIANSKMKWPLKHNNNNHILN